MLVILGVGGHALEVLDIAEAMDQQPTRFSVGPWREIELAGPEDDAKLVGEPGPFALGSGAPSIRKRLVERYGAGSYWPALVHPSAVVSPRATIGAGAVIAAGAIIGAGSVVEDWALINYNATLGHGCRVKRFGVVLPGANLACDTIVGEGARIGAGAQLLPKVQVGDWAEVASSSMVAKDVPPHGHAIGVPARVMRLDDEH